MLLTIDWSTWRNIAFRSTAKLTHGLTAFRAKALPVDLFPAPHTRECFNCAHDDSSLFLSSRYWHTQYNTMEHVYQS